MNRSPHAALPAAVPLGSRCTGARGCRPAQEPAAGSSLTYTTPSGIGIDCVRQHGAVLALAGDRHVRAVQHDGRRALEAVVGRRVVVQRGVRRREVALGGRCQVPTVGVDRGAVAGHELTSGRAAASRTCRRAPAGRAARDLDPVVAGLRPKYGCRRPRSSRSCGTGRRRCRRRANWISDATCRRVPVVPNVARPAQAAARGPVAWCALLRAQVRSRPGGRTSRRRPFVSDVVQLGSLRLVVRVVDVVQEALGAERGDDRRFVLAVAGAGTAGGADAELDRRSTNMLPGVARRCTDVWPVVGSSSIANCALDPGR